MDSRSTKFRNEGIKLAIQFFILSMFLGLSSAFAFDLYDKEAYGFYLENDSRNIGGPGSDQSYTNGLKISYIYAQGQIPKWATPMIDRFHILEDKARWAKINFGLSLGHQIFTPNNTQATILVPEDRPYAARLYLGFAVSLKEKAVEHFLEVDLGTIGPSALGEQIQNGFHGLIGSNKAKGWSFGLKDEPALQIFYQKRFKIIHSETFDFTPYYGAGLGNVFVGAHIGSMIRFGPHLPDDFGSGRPSAGDGNSFISSSSYSKDSKKTYYLFAGLRGNYVKTNIFLDGNTYQNSHSVTKYPNTFESEFGLGLHFKPGTIVWRFVTKSPEFYERSEFNSFASIGFVYTPNHSEN